jgi:splicing factor 3B subunit 2
MGKAKEKKKQRKERNAQLHASFETIAAAQEAAADEEYVESEDDEDANDVLHASLAPGAPPPRIDSDDEEVDVNVVPAAASAQATSRKRPRRTKFTLSDLKQQILDTFDGPLAHRLCGLADEHDGRAVDPLFTVWLKGLRGAVPVPPHWRKMSEFLSKQTDRESCTDIVPPEVEATDVQLLRQATKKVPANMLKFFTCFLSGSPLLRKRFGCNLTKHGEVFRQGQWLPPKAYVPGAMSEQLRQALGLAGALAPPPWLRSMQALKKLPPAYSTLLVPGLNAPIPTGGHWGMAEGQWGEPVRQDATGGLMFPQIMDDPAEVAARLPVHWGDVPPRATAAVAAAAAAQPQQPVASRPTEPSALAPKAVPAYTGPPIVAPAFYPSDASALPYRPPAASGESFYQGEYVRAADGAAPGILLAGSKLVPKLPAGKPSAPAASVAQTYAQPSANPTKF